MKQSESQLIGLRAEDIFNYLRPKYWLIRNQSKIDFGVDFEIEILNQNRESTGLIAKVQLKGSEDLKYIDDNTKVSFSFDIENAKYLIEEIKIPSYLIVCDNNLKKCYWVSFKTNQKLKEAYHNALEKKQNSFTIHLDVSNDFSANYNEIIKDIELSNKFIGLTTIKSINFYDYSEISKTLNIDEVKKALLLQIENIDIKEIQKEYDNGNFQKALDLIDTIIKSNEKTNTCKFNATSYKRAILRILIAKQNFPLNEKTQYLNNMYLNISEELISLTKDLSDDDTTKIYSQLWRHIATVGIISNQIQWHKINLKMHEADPNEWSDFWVANVSLQLRKLYIQISNEINEIQTKIDIIIKNNDFRFFIDLIPEFILSISGFLFFLMDEVKDSFIKIENYFDLLVNLALSFIATLDIDNKWDKYNYLIRTKLSYKSSYVNKDYPKYLDKLKNEIYPFVFKIEDVNIRKNLLLYIKEYGDNLKEIQSTSIDDYSIEEEIDIYRANLEAMGVNLDDPQNETDRAIKEAFEAINPERVLKNCIHLYVYQASVSPLGHWVKLNTLGMKGLCCILHKYRTENVFLDNVWNFFDWEFCSKCKDKQPHPNDWKWSRKWQQEQDDKYYNKLFPRNKV